MIPDPTTTLCATPEKGAPRLTVNDRIRHRVFGEGRIVRVFLSPCRISKPRHSVRPCSGSPYRVTFIISCAFCVQPWMSFPIRRPRRLPPLTSHRIWSSSSQACAPRSRWVRPGCAAPASPRRLPQRPERRSSESHTRLVAHPDTGRSPQRWTGCSTRRRVPCRRRAHVRTFACPGSDLRGCSARSTAALDRGAHERIALPVAGNPVEPACIAAGVRCSADEAPQRAGASQQLDQAKHPSTRSYAPRGSDAPTLRVGPRRRANRLRPRRPGRHRRLDAERPQDAPTRSVGASHRRRAREAG